jgi:hypothetical protein
MKNTEKVDFKAKISITKTIITVQPSSPETVLWLTL